MEFKIVEGGTDDDSFYEEFKTDFINPEMTIMNLMEKYGISQNHYNKLRQRVIDETALVRKPQKHYCENREYINKKGGKWAVVKRIDGTINRFGVYDNLNTAITIRDSLIACNWDKNQLFDIKEEALLKEKLEEKLL